MKRVTKVLLIALLLVALGWTINAARNSSTDRASATGLSETCPPKQFKIGDVGGEALCRDEPLGCPYVEGITFDSPKCVLVESEDEPCTIEQPTEEPTTETPADTDTNVGTPAPANTPAPAPAVTTVEEAPLYTSGK